MMLASWAYGLEFDTRPVLSCKLSLDLCREQVTLDLEGAIAGFKLLDQVDEVRFGERNVLQRDARYLLIGSVNNVVESLLSRDVVKFNSDSICFTILQYHIRRIADSELGESGVGECDILQVRLVAEVCIELDTSGR